MERSVQQDQRGKMRKPNWSTDETYRLDYVIAFLGGDGPQAPPLDPIDLNIEEILKEKNATIDGNLPQDAAMFAIKQIHDIKSVEVQEHQVHEEFDQQQQLQPPKEQQQTPLSDVTYQGAQKTEAPVYLFDNGGIYIYIYEMTESNLLEGNGQESEVHFVVDSHKISVPEILTKETYESEKRRLKLLKLQTEIDFLRALSAHFKEND